MKYYAVKVGHKPGIYTNWDETKAQVSGYPGAMCKKFNNLDDAKAYYENDAKTQTSAETQNEPMHNGPYAYVDGSYNTETNVYGYGVYMKVNDTTHILQGASNDTDKANMRNVAGELSGCMAAISKALELKLDTLNLHYDYEGIAAWATGSWKATKEYTKDYREFMKNAMKHINIRFIKIKSHTGVEGNEKADRLAKQSVSMF